MSTPNQQAVSESQHLDFSFSVPERGLCTVHVSVQPNQDPKHQGQGLVGLYQDPDVVKGYPVLRATVSSSEYRTYASLYGWVQITNAPGEPWVMDLYPMFEDLNSPFMSWGAEPTLVDAPGRQGVEHYDWTARSFLCYTPDAAMTKRVLPIMGFEWGFWIENYKPYVKCLQKLDVSCWDSHLELFRDRFVGWTFEQVHV
ncbi:hypothetical protein H2198_008092 [Neophaeococcomyces mojaviensis]|uniref:Uncharacterized protein n=1 Tax=Neophaeococcomyces mojaviensis TaxID=3383035 RepID=A0ACC2ZY25_9EURO|nr:hypothetical protein H2198_008092 [Knufia sp. JES_112]